MAPGCEKERPGSPGGRLEARIRAGGEGGGVERGGGGATVFRGRGRESVEAQRETRRREQPRPIPERRRDHEMESLVKGPDRGIDDPVRSAGPRLDISLGDRPLEMADTQAGLA